MSASAVDRVGRSCRIPRGLGGFSDFLSKLVRLLSTTASTRESAFSAAIPIGGNLGRVPADGGRVGQAYAGAAVPRVFGRDPVRRWTRVLEHHDYIPVRRGCRRHPIGLAKRFQRDAPTRPRSRTLPPSTRIPPASPWRPYRQRTLIRARPHHRLERVPQLQYVSSADLDRHVAGAERRAC